MSPLLIAHRGNTTTFPENSMQAFTSAFERGADGIELDVQWIEEQLLVVHDYQFDPTQSFAVLEDVLNVFIGKGQLEIDIKSFSTEILTPLKNLLSRYSLDKIELTTAELAMVQPIKKLFPQLNIGVIFGTDHYQPWMEERTLVKKTVELMQTMNAQVAHVSVVPPHLLTENLVSKLHEKNIRVHSHIPKIELKEQVRLYQHFDALSVDELTFDDMALLGAVRK
jgi:glycerophosphoryl diester phosphodiesterase